MGWGGGRLARGGWPWMPFRDAADRIVRRGPGAPQTRAWGETALRPSCAPRAVVPLPHVRCRGETRARWEPAETDVPVRPSRRTERGPRNMCVAASPAAATASCDRGTGSSPRDTAAGVTFVPGWGAGVGPGFRPPTAALPAREGEPLQPPLHRHVFSHTGPPSPDWSPSQIVTFPVATWSRAMSANRRRFVKRIETRLSCLLGKGGRGSSWSPNAVQGGRNLSPGPALTA